MRMPHPQTRATRDDDLRRGQDSNVCPASGAQRLDPVDSVCIFEMPLLHKGFVSGRDAECRGMTACLRVVCG
jgi:hypothetical protein